MLRRRLALAFSFAAATVVAACPAPEPPQVRVVESEPDPAVVGEGGTEPPSAIHDPREAPDDEPPADEPPADEPPADEPAPTATGPTCSANAVTGDYCAGDKVSHCTTGTLYRCHGPGAATVIRACTDGCVVAPAGQDDDCRPPAPTCDANAFTGDYCAGDKVSHGEEDTLYRCSGPGPATVREECQNGCVVAPPGQDDYCAAAECAHAALLRWGLAPRASDHLRCASVSATRITQTIGSAPASAGYHAQDGTISGAPYCAATDLSVSGMTQTQIRALLGRLADGGFAAFYRWPGHDGWPSSEAAHIHAVYAGVSMKWQLDGQVEDWLAGRNGLASHGSYTFWQPSGAQKDLVRALFNAHN